MMTVEQFVNRIDDLVAAFEDAVPVEREIARELADIRAEAKLFNDILSSLAEEVGRLVDHFLDAPAAEERTFE